MGILSTEHERAQPTSKTLPLCDIICGTKEIPLSQRVGYVMGGWISERCMSHQSDWMYYQTPIKFPVVKVNGM